MSRYIRDEHLYLNICFYSFQSLLIKIFLAECFGRNKKNNNNKYRRRKKTRETFSDNKKRRGTHIHICMKRAYRKQKIS